MIERKNHLDTRAITLLIACCAFWGLQQILIKTTVDRGAAAVAGLDPHGGRRRAAVAVVRMARRAAVRARRHAAGGLLAGALFAGEFICIYIGLQHTTASRLTVFLYTSPFVVALLLPRFVPAERLRGVQWVGLAIAFAGVVLAFSESFGHSTSGQLLGDALALAAGVLWGLTTLAIRTTRLATASAEKTLFYQIAVTAAVSPRAVAAAGRALGFLVFDLRVVLDRLQTAIGAFASYLAWMWMLRHYPATRISSFTFLTPLFALVFGVVLLYGAADPATGAGARRRGLGIVLVNRRAGGEAMNFQPILDDIHAEIRAAAGRRRHGRQLHPGAGARAGAAVRHRAAHLRGRRRPPPATRRRRSRSRASPSSSRSRSRCGAWATRCGSASAASLRAIRSTRWCNSRTSRASRAIPSSMRAPSRWPTGS